jgi:hypothetical protein
MILLLLLTIILILISALTVKFILPILTRHSQLRKEYQTISLLPVSSIPFVGNVNHLSGGPRVFFELLCRMGKECQDQNKGAFCFWFTLWPTVFLCSAKGLEVTIFYVFSQN